MAIVAGSKASSYRHLNCRALPKALGGFVVVDTPVLAEQFGDALGATLAHHSRFTLNYLDDKYRMNTSCLRSSVVSSLEKPNFNLSGQGSASHLIGTKPNRA
jgi:hypothetical protein